MRLLPAARFVSQSGLGILVATATMGRAAATCSAVDMIFIGNSYTGGRSVGRACDENRQPQDCENMAIPGNVRDFSPETYPGEFDRAPNSDTLIDPNAPYNPSTNPHRGDVPSKIKLLAEHICTGVGGSGNSFQYVQNTQSAMTTRTHAGQANSNFQNGTIQLLEGYTAAAPYDDVVVVIQPQGTEYLHGATDTRIAALQELMKTRRHSSADANAFVRFVVQQTWPRRDATTYNQICTTGRGNNRKTGMLQEMDQTLLELAQAVTQPFQVAPTGRAFVEFAKLACGQGILPEGDCALDSTVDCPIWFGQSGNVSLYDEIVGEEGSHQSDEIGAWLAATVLYGVTQSTTPCYVSVAHLASVMPPLTPASLALVPTGHSIHFLISEAARLALRGDDNLVVEECTNGGTVTTLAPNTESPKPLTEPSSAPSSAPIESPKPSTVPSSDPSPAPATTPATCGQKKQECCAEEPRCVEGGSICKRNGRCS